MALVHKRRNASARSGTISVGRAPQDRVVSRSCVVTSTAHRVPCLSSTTSGPSSVRGRTVRSSADRDPVAARTANSATWPPADQVQQPRQGLPGKDMTWCGQDELGGSIDPGHRLDGHLSSGRIGVGEQETPLDPALHDPLQATGRP
jgi:hypothetical protein